MTPENRTFIVLCLQSCKNEDQYENWCAWFERLKMDDESRRIIEVFHRNHIYKFAGGQLDGQV
jgi:hypothetical protein